MVYQASHPPLPSPHHADRPQPPWRDCRRFPSSALSCEPLCQVSLSLGTRSIDELPVDCFSTGGGLLGVTPRNGQNCTLSHLAETGLAFKAGFASSAGEQHGRKLKVLAMPWREA